MGTPPLDLPVRSGWSAVSFVYAAFEAAGQKPLGIRLMEQQVFAFADSSPEE